MGGKFLLQVETFRSLEAGEWVIQGTKLGQSGSDSRIRKCSGCLENVVGEFEERGPAWLKDAGTFR